MGEDNPVAAPSLTGATFSLNSIKLHVLVLILPINDNITFLENLKQGFKTTVSWNKYRSEKKIYPKNNNLDYVIDPAFRNINRLFVLSFKNGAKDTSRNSFDKYYMRLVKIKDFNTLIDDNDFFINPPKNQK